MRQVIRFVLFLSLGVLLIAGTALADSTTFKVDLSVMQELGLFNPATMTVHVRGNINGWGDGSDLADFDGDYIYEAKIDVGTTSPVDYKFVVKEGNTVNWEDNIGNRNLIPAGTNQVLDPVEWNNGIQFRVNMKAAIAGGTFTPTTQFISIAGAFNDWLGTGIGISNGDSTTARKYELTLASGDTLYQANVPFGTSANKFKFTINNNSDGKIATWEGHADRSLLTSEMTLAAPRNLMLPWDGDPGVTVTGTVLFQVDITPLKELGLFNESEGDTLELRGGFNGWDDSDPDDSIMRQSFLDPNIYELPITMNKGVGTQEVYKFYIKYNLNRAFWSSIPSPSAAWGWEEPGSTGGGNRTLIFTGQAQQTLPVQTYNDIFNVIPANQAVTMHFVADMRCFLRNPPIPVDKSLDTLRLDIQDPTWHILNGSTLYLFQITQHGQSPFDFSDADGDSIYGLSLTVNGPLQNWVQYHLNWQGYDDRAPGFDLGRRRVRYARPDAQGNYASDYEMGVDYIHTEIAPLVVEDPNGQPVNDPAPCSVTTSVEQTDPNAPASYALGNNYPNPFNPSTTFEYSLRTNGRVTITLYNALGQKIADLVNEDQAAGKYKVNVDLSDLSRSSLATGVYFYQIKAGDFTATRRMMFLK